MKQQQIRRQPSRSERERRRQRRAAITNDAVLVSASASHVSVDELLADIDAVLIAAD